MTFASRDLSYKMILDGAFEVQCGGRNCTKMVKITNDDRLHAKAVSKLGSLVVLCKECQAKIGEAK